MSYRTDKLCDGKDDGYEVFGGIDRMTGETTLVVRDTALDNTQSFSLSCSPAKPIF
jgi:hypothetical protein